MTHVLPLVNGNGLQICLKKAHKRAEGLEKTNVSF